jgi:hypothetical protein
MFLLIRKRRLAQWQLQTAHVAHTLLNLYSLELFQERAIIWRAVRIVGLRTRNSKSRADA